MHLCEDFDSLYLVLMSRDPICSESQIWHRQPPGTKIGDREGQEGKETFVKALGTFSG